MKITEEMKIHEEWYKEAKTITRETLLPFIDKLINEYEHDYGTICHACAAAAIAATYAVERSPQGAITGFQGSAIMWQYIIEWMGYKDKPLRLLQIDEMLYPQSEYKFNTISRETFNWLQKKAQEKLSSNTSMAETVANHMKSIVDGRIPFGYGVVDE